MSINKAMIKWIMVTPCSEIGSLQD
jgi:hypothetical protein